MFHTTITQLPITESLITTEINILGWHHLFYIALIQIINLTLNRVINLIQ